MEFGGGFPDEFGAGERVGGSRQMPDLVPGVVVGGQERERPGGIRDIGKGMADVGIDQPLSPLAFDQPLEDEEVGKAGLVGAGAKEVGGAGDGGGDIAFPDLAHQLGSYPGPQIAFAACRVVGGFFGHRARGLTIHIYVVEKEQFGPGLLARGNYIVDDPGPLPAPEGIVVGHTDTAINDSGVAEGFERLCRVGNIGGEGGRARNGFGVAGNEADRQLTCYKFTGQGIGDYSIGAKDGVDRSGHTLKYYGIKINRF